jgi:hypothetical protein
VHFACVARKFRRVVATHRSWRSASASAAALPVCDEQTQAGPAKNCSLFFRLPGSVMFVDCYEVLQVSPNVDSCTARRVELA